MTEVRRIQRLIDSVYISPTVRLFTAEYVTLRTTTYESEYNDAHITPISSSTVILHDDTLQVKSQIKSIATAHVLTVTKFTFTKTDDHPSVHIYGVLKHIYNIVNGRSVNSNCAIL